MDQLNALPYLDMVVRETLRVHAPVPSTIRVAMKDDVLPLSKPFTDRRGHVQTSIQYVTRRALVFPYIVTHATSV
jgi:cytochrome P450